MTPIPFPADLYWHADWAFTHAQDIPHDSIQSIFPEAQARVLEELHRSYFNAVEVYRLPLRTGSWIENAPLQELALEAGKIYVTLDYYAACLPLPRRVKRMGREKEGFLYEYLCRRGLENLEANAHNLLRSLAITSLIPDEWFPQKSLEGRIEKEIRRTGMYRQTQIDLNLRLAPGGLHWLSDATRETLTRVREKLAGGQPWPVRMICCPGRLHGNRQVIVYGCHEQKGGKLRLEIFEPGFALKEHALQVVTRGDRLKVVEILGPGREMPVPGLLYEAYDPADLPQECIPWWLRWMPLRRLWLRLMA
jgi:hypothetical protein